MMIIGISLLSAEKEKEERYTMKDSIKQKVRMNVTGFR
jgi:hypothetical protein